MKNYVMAILGAGIWMNISEIIRNELILKQLWVDGFKELGLSFPSSSLNGAVWGLWTFIFVVVLSLLTTKFGVLKSTIIGWVLGFVLLWIAMWNMGILPRGILYWAVPWSFLEVNVAAMICNKFVNSNT